MSRMDNLEYIVDTTELEPLCIAMRKKSTIIFLYPYQDAVAKTGAKVVTRDGRVVRKVRKSLNGGKVIITGLLDGEFLTWDSAGRFIGPYEDSEKDLYIPERFFVKGWKNEITLSNSDWALKYDIKHPDVKVPELKQY